MNIQQALTDLTGLGGAFVLSRSPDNVPGGRYAVVSELSDGVRARYHVQPGGGLPTRRTLTLLVTLYGADTDTEATLRPLYGALRSSLHLRLTEHPGLPRPSVQPGPCLPPQTDPASRRPWCAVRLLLTYVE